jgi:hypothetical protein
MRFISGPAEWHRVSSEREWRVGGLVAMAKEYVRIRFALDPTDWHGAPTEILWAEPYSDGRKRGFQLMNSPFYARGASYLDIVTVTLAPDKLVLNYAGTIEKSGHSNIWIQIKLPEPSGFESYLASLRQLGCTYESTSMNTDDTRLYSIDVPPETDMDRVLSILEQGEASDIWLFMISHLVHKSNRTTTRG